MIPVSMPAKKAKPDSLHDTDADALGLHHIILFGDLAEIFRDPSGQPVGGFGLQVKAELAVDFLEGNVGVDQPCIGARGLEDGARFGEFVVDVPCDFFENVAAGHDARHTAVFIHHDGQPDLVLLETREQAIEGNALRNKDRRKRRGLD